MNKIHEKDRLGLAMNSDGEHTEFLKAVPNPIPDTQYQAVEWEQRGNLNILWLYPAPHPIETVAYVTEHFATLDEARLAWLCEQNKIDVKDIKLSQGSDDLPKTQADALRKLLRDKFPMPKGKPVIPAKTVQVRERVLVLDPSVAELDIKSLEKEAAKANGINAFKAEVNKGATLGQLRALVTRLKDKKRAMDQAARKPVAGVMQRA